MLTHVNREDEQQYKRYRLLVKSRLNKQHQEVCWRRIDVRVSDSLSRTTGAVESRR